MLKVESTSASDASTSGDRSKVGPRCADRHLLMANPGRPCHTASPPSQLLIVPIRHPVLRMIFLT